MFIKQIFLFCLCFEIKIKTYSIPTLVRMILYRNVSSIQTLVRVEVQVYLWDYCLSVQGIQPTQRLGATELLLFTSPNSCLLLIVLEMFSQSSNAACYENLVPSFVVRPAHENNSRQVILFNRRLQF